MNVSFSMFYLSVITLKFPYNKMFKSHQYQQIQKMIKEKGWDSKIENIITVIDGIFACILAGIFPILFLNSSLSKFCQAILVVLLFWCNCGLIWNIVFLLVSLFFCKCSYSAFLKEWETQ